MHICYTFRGENLEASLSSAICICGAHISLNASLHKFLCLNPSFFSTNDEVTREQRQQLTQAEECEMLLWDTS